MACWNEIMAKAVSAKKTLTDDRFLGEAAFDELIREFPQNGMVRFQQGQGYEARGDAPHARDSYAMAENLFEVVEWRRRATTGRLRCSLPPSPAE